MTGSQDEPTTREELRDVLDEAIADAIENGVDQTTCRQEAEKLADRTRLTEYAANQVVGDE